MTITQDSKSDTSFDPMPFKIGTQALYQGERVTVEDVQGVWRQIARYPNDPNLWVFPPTDGPKILNREKVLADRLKPLGMFDTPSPDGVGETEKIVTGDLLAAPAPDEPTDTPTIAALEMELAQAKDDLIADLRRDVSEMKTALAKESDALRTKTGLLANASKIMAVQKQEIETLKVASIPAKPFPAGTSARHLDEPVFVIDDSRLAQRRVLFLEQEERGVEFVELIDLRPDDDAMSLEEVVVALVNQTFVKQELIEDLLRESKATDGRVTNLQRVIERANERIRTLQAQVDAPPVKRKIETKVLYDPPMAGLEMHLNAGWRVVFETVFIQPFDENGDPSRGPTHFLRLEREALEPVSPPQDEALESVPAPADLFGITTISSGTVDTPVTMIFHLDKPILVPTMGPTYEPIDPADIDLTRPLAENVQRYGPKAVGQAQNLQIAAGMGAMKLHYSEIAQRLYSIPFASRTITAQP